MNKGFTLVEMLLILIFISIISLMAVPNITNMIKKGEEDKYNTFKNDIFLATEAYIEKYKDDYPSLNNNLESTYIYMQDLVDEKFVSTNLVNPNNNRTVAVCNDAVCVADDYTIIIKKDEDGKYKYCLRVGLYDSDNDPLDDDTCE